MPKIILLNNWHCIIDFLINAAPLNVYFILHCRLFFHKKIVFSNVYILVNTIFDCLHMIFGWERDHQPSTYVTVGGRGSSKCAQQRTGEGVSRLMHTYTLTLSLSMFVAAYLSYSILFICRNLTLLLLEKHVFLRKGYLGLTRSISVVMN